MKHNLGKWWFGDLALVSDPIQGLKEKLETWKEIMRSKGLTVNVKNMKMMISREIAREIEEEEKIFSVVCRKDLGVIPSSANFTCAGCIRDVLYKLDWVDWRKIVNVNVWYA